MTRILGLHPPENSMPNIALNQLLEDYNVQSAPIAGPRLTPSCEAHVPGVVIAGLS